MTTQSTSHRKISQQTRFIIEKDAYRPEYECSHELCDQLHRRWHRSGICTKPHAEVIQWIIIDQHSTDRHDRRMYLGFSKNGSWEYKKEAVAALTYHLNSLTDAEWQQIAGA